MFCYQCQEAAKGTGCEIKGVCGKAPETSNLQDLLLFVVKGISYYSTQCNERSITLDNKTNRFVFESLFATITNANFDNAVFTRKIAEGIAIRNDLRKQLESKGITFNNAQLPDAASWNPKSEDEYAIKALVVGIFLRFHLCFGRTKRRYSFFKIVIDFWVKRLVSIHGTC